VVAIAVSLLGASANESMLKEVNFNFGVDNAANPRRRLDTGSFEWQELGAIDGSFVNGGFGKAVAMSALGTVIAVGSDSANTTKGLVKIFGFNGVSFVQRGSTLTGVADFEYYGRAVALSDDGDVLAVSNGDFLLPQTVTMYEWSGSDYVKRDDVSGNEDFGKSIALSGDGGVLAIGSSTAVSGGAKVGSASVYEWNSTHLVLRAPPVYGDAVYDKLGVTVALSNDGSVLAAGAEFNDGDGVNITGNALGQLKLYAFNGTDYESRGHPLYGGGVTYWLGHSIALSSSGDIAAVSAYGSNQTTRVGEVIVLQWDNSSQVYVQRGSTIYGESEGDKSGSSVSLSSSGNVLAIGAFRNDGGGNDSGHVRVYEWSGTDYLQKGHDIDGLSAGDELGGEAPYSISLSDNGDVVIGGSPKSNSGMGQVRVFEWVDTEEPKKWGIELVKFEADFSINSTDELMLRYVMGRGRQYKFDLLQKDCETPISDVGYSAINVTEFKNWTYQYLDVNYSFNKSQLANSSIYNETKIEVCHVLSLNLEKAGTSMIISEDLNVLTVDLDMNVDYSIDVGLAPAAAPGEKNTTVDDMGSYIRACACDGPPFKCTSAPHLPNSELYLCFWSVESAVEIETMENMTISQGAVKLPVIVNGVVVYPSITEVTPEPAKNGILITTRVPSNVINFETGATIDVYGDMLVDFVGSRRKLIAGDMKSIVNKEEKAPFEFTVTLAQEMENESVLMDSSAFVGRSVHPILGLIFALAFGLL